MNTVSLNWIILINQLHAWGDCTRYGNDRHCHCSLEVRAIENKLTYTCRHCGETVEPK